MTDPKIARWYQKANAFSAAWERRYKVRPAKHTVCLGLCQPSAETACGDSWRGPDGILGTADDTRNWGAATLRSLNAAEREAILAAMREALADKGIPARGMLEWISTAQVAWNAGIDPVTKKKRILSLSAPERETVTLWLPSVSTGHAERAKAAQAAIVAAGLPLPSGTKRGVFVPRGEIHCDSTTELLANGAKATVPYFVWFGAFDDDVSGAEYYLTFVGDEGNPARAVLLNPNGTVYQLAAAAYARGYFYGFHPHKKYTTAGPDGVMGTADDVDHDGNQENIAAYGKWLAPHHATIKSALKDWVPDGAPPDHPDTEPAPAPALDLTDARDLQKGLNLLACAIPELKIDGDIADKTKAALGFYQGISAMGGYPGITMTGRPDAPTLAGMRKDLTTLGHAVKS